MLETYFLSHSKYITNILAHLRGYRHLYRANSKLKRFRILRDNLFIYLYSFQTIKQI